MADSNLISSIAYSPPQYHLSFECAEIRLANVDSGVMHSNVRVEDAQT